MPSVITMLDYTSFYQPWFEKLNRHWIEQYFWMEPIDVAVLQDPDGYIIKKGGAILMACVDEEIAGTVALKYVEPGVYEFTKMAVDEKFQGQKVGLALAEAALQKAKSLGAEKIILYSSTKLIPALSLYRKLGFIEIPLDGPYKRSDIKMQLIISKPMSENIRIRTATINDARLLAELGATTFHDTFKSSNTDEDMKLYLANNFSTEQLESEFKEEGSIFIIAEDKDKAVGYAKMRKAGEPEGLNESNQIEIERIYSSKEYIGKAVGKTLMEACLDIAKKAGHNVAWLGVWEHNPRAISFYEKWGFIRFGTHPFLLGTDLQTDILMKKQLV
ncbi:MAG TPA: GNAT family N-acetyltransferase [Chryseolinea sp.]|nr:GNAT family N-acetyltransferase [Chryseolinea sp.]